MPPDLSQFDAMQPSAVIKALKQQGFAIIGDGTDSVVLARDEDPYVIRLTNFAGQAEAFARICQQQDNNPYFPKILATHRSEGVPPVFLTQMERLLTLDDIPEGPRSIVGGFARALALLIDGHESHDAAHAQMLKNPEVAGAVLALITAMEEALQQNSETFLYYDSGYSENWSGPVDDWYPDNILFRPNEQGSWSLVFADPLREGRVRDEAHRAGLAQELAVLRKRLYTAAMPKETDPVMKGPSPNL